MSLLSFAVLVLLASVAVTELRSALVTDSVDWKSFLGRHSLMWRWSRNDHSWIFVPDDWSLAPFTGNGLLGTLGYICDPEQGPGGARCDSVGETPEFRLELGRQDVYDQRQPYDSLLERPRLPVGYLRLQTAGSILGGNMTLDIWNALLNGTISTSKGTIAMTVLTHSIHDVIIITWNVTKGESGAKWFFEPETSCYQNQEGCSSHPNPPQKCGSFHFPTIASGSDGTLCTQLLQSPYMGNFSSAFLTGSQGSQQVMFVSISSSIWPHNTTVNSQTEAIQTLQNVSSLNFSELISSHMKAWNSFYQMSFLSISDTRLEAFYWIQMYMMRSSMRVDGPVRDLIGPWFINSNWPAIWNDLSLQLTYWPVYTANHLDLGNTLLNHLQRNFENGHWTWNCVHYNGSFYPQHSDSIGIGGACSSDGFSPMMEIETQDSEFGNLLWLCHNVWLQCQYSYNQTCFETMLLPLLSRSVAWYRHFLVSVDNVLRLPPTRSPEYPPPLGWDASYDIGLLRWGCSVLVQLCLNAVNEPVYPCNMTDYCEVVLRQLTELHVDRDTGIMVYANTTFHRPHRHFSHLLAWLPLHTVTTEDEDFQDILVKSLDTYYGVTHGSDQMMGFWYAGVAAMSALAGRGSAAIGNLSALMDSEVIAPNTFCTEGNNPVPESSAAAAYALQTTLVQSHGGKIRIFPATPRTGPHLWSQAVFHRLRAERAFLVSASMDGNVQWVLVESEMGASPCSIEVDLVDPLAFNSTSPHVSVNRSGSKGIDIVGLQQGDAVLIYSQDNKPDKFEVRELVGNQTEYHYFGYHKPVSTTA